MKPSNRHPFVILLLIFGMGLALSASKLKLPTFIRGTPAAIQAQPVVLANNASDPAKEIVPGPGDDRSVSLQTDKTEYARGEVIIITGSGWDPGEAVTLLLHEAPAIHADRSLNVIADAAGNILDNQFVQDAHDVMFLVTATGRNSGLTTQAAFGNPAYNLDQCANGPFSAQVPCTGTAWVNGDLNANGSHYKEGNSVPFRLKFSNLTSPTRPPGSHTYSVVLQWDTTKSGKHAYDFLTGYDFSETSADPCSGISGCSFTSTWPIPLDPNIVSDGATSNMRTGHSQLKSSGNVSQNFTCFNCTITGTSTSPFYTLSGSYAGDSSTSITVNFTASVSNPVLAWGGHIASTIDWLSGGAGTVSGSPYHMRVLSLDAVGGNQDRSLKASAVLPEPNIVTSVSPTTVNNDGSTTVTDTATFSPASPSTATPAGTASFFACGPTVAAQECTNGGADAGANVALDASGVATSNAFLPTGTGWFCFRVEYTPAAGSPYSPGVSTTTSGECVQVLALTNTPTVTPTNTPPPTATPTPLPPCLSTDQSLTPNDSATIDSGNAGGTIEFDLYSPSDSSCSGTPAFTQTVNATTGGTYYTTNTGTGAFVASAEGTWRWKVIYKDAFNTVTSTCGTENFVIANNHPACASALRSPARLAKSRPPR